jgi:hypothetical protein
MAQGRNKKMRMVTMHGATVVKGEAALALRLAASQSFRDANLRRRLERVEIRHRHTPERLSVEKAMLSVEEAFVKAIWVLQRTEGGDGPAGYTSGMSYRAEDVDLIGQAIAEGGWKTPAPRPAIPSAKEITAAERIQTWVLMLEPLPARVLTVGAMSKCGDAGRKVNWMRVKGRLPELDGYSTRSLQGLYTGALRDLVAELTTQRMMACA